MSTILFVDDDLAFLESMQRVFKAWSAGTPIVIETAHSVGDAITVLQESTVNVVVVDIRMPVVDGMQFLRLLNRKHPTVQKAILTGYAEEDYRTACLAHGAALFLEKPRNSDEMRSVYAALLQILEVPQTRGFSGVLQQASLADMLQMLCTGGNSLVLQVKSNDGLAEIFIRNGAVIHARLEAKEGYDAFYHVMTMRGGEFFTRPFVEPPKITMEQSWEHLLMESARLMDEKGLLDQPDPGPASAGGSFPVPKTTRIAFPPVTAGPAAVGSLPAVPSYAAAERSRERIELGVRDNRKRTIPVEFSSIRLAQKPIPTATNLKLDELVLCSPDGELIQNIGSQNPERRVDFLELFSIKMRQITGRPEWGGLDYLAIHGADYTATVEFPEGMGSFGLVKKKNIPAHEVHAAVAKAAQSVAKVAKAAQNVPKIGRTFA